MSSDNAIFIAGFQDGYRVVHDFMPVYEYLGSIIDEGELISFFKDMFKDSATFESFEEAKYIAEELSKNYYLLEYGIQNLGYFDFSLSGENIMNVDYDNLFWIVVNKDFPTRVTYKHDSEQSAIDEAKRLAKENPDQEFIVMESVESYVYSNYTKKKFVLPGENPHSSEYIPF